MGNQNVQFISLLFLDDRFILGVMVSVKRFIQTYWISTCFCLWLMRGHVIVLSIDGCHNQQLLPRSNTIISEIWPEESYTKYINNRIGIQESCRKGKSAFKICRYFANVKNEMAGFFRGKNASVDFNCAYSYIQVRSLLKWNNVLIAIIYEINNANT